VNPIQTNRFQLRTLENSGEMDAVEKLQRLVWPGDDFDAVPGHMLLAAVHNGGLLIGAYADHELVGFVFGFPGLYFTPDGPRAKHCSHMLGVLPDYQDQGLGFMLKRAQWQMVRSQGLDRITWTFDPLLSRNAHLNIARLGAVCNTYLPNEYGKMRDALNQGLPSDRFQVDWWVNSGRTSRRLSRQARPPLKLNHYLSAGMPIINPVQFGPDGLPAPIDAASVQPGLMDRKQQMVLIEIPADFMSLKLANPSLALEWRLHARLLFESAFESGYLVTDFVRQADGVPRSFYVLSYGETLMDGLITVSH
jgi:predicted GNAT superfamily acetyltransferase